MTRTLRLAMLALLLVTISGNAVQAQSPSPSPTPNADKTGTDLADSLHRMSSAATDFVPAFVREVEKPLGGYFELIAWWLAWLVFMVAFLSVLRASSDDPTELFWQCARAAVIFALLGYMGDTNGDGIRGDLVNNMGSVGNTIAYGRLNDEGSTGYLQKLVSTQQRNFNNNYKDFVNNTFTVKVNNEDLPVKYPTDGSPFQRLSVLYSKGDDLKAVNEAFSPSGWSMENLYQWLGGARSLIEFGDLFLLILQGFLVATMRLAAPFMIAVAINREWAKQISIPFAKSCVIVTMVMPIISQIVRFFAYLAGNMAMDLASSDPYYQWDPTTLQIVAQGNPVWIIMIAAIVMTFIGLCMIGSPWISYKIASGQVLEAVTGMITSWTGAATSTAISAYSAAAGAAINKQAEQTQIQGNTTAGQIEAQSTRAAANTEARSRATAESVRSRATAEEASMNAAATASAQNERALAGMDRTEQGEVAGFEASQMDQQGKVLGAASKAQVGMDKLPYDMTREIPLVGPIVAGMAETGRNIASGVGATGTAGDVIGSKMPTPPTTASHLPTVGTVDRTERFQPPDSGNFSLQRDGGALRDAYRQQFGHDLPVNVGQRGVHNREHYNHTNAMDAPLNPNSAEGRWVRSYCRENGVPYFAAAGAYRSPITGKVISTGEHIHIGKTSGSSHGQTWQVGTVVPTGNRPPLQFGGYQVPNRTGAPFAERTAMAPVDEASITANYSIAAAGYRAQQNINASRGETSRVIGANNYEASVHSQAAWGADASRQRAIGMEFHGSTTANQIRYGGSMEGIKARHEAMTAAARLHAVGSVYQNVGATAASQMQSVFQQFNRY